MSPRKGVYNIHRAHKVPHKSKMGSYRAWTAMQVAPYDGGKVSSRHVPNRLKIPPVGSWLYEGTFKGLYGHSIDQLVSFKPSALTPMEVMVERNENGRGDDSRRYMGWWAEGSEPPPIRVVQSEGGDLRITDGHRRYFAAKLLGKPIKAWVSWTVPSPRYEVGQGDLSEVYDSTYPLIATGLTYEIAEARGWVARNGQSNSRRATQRNAFSRGSRNAGSRNAQPVSEATVLSHWVKLYAEGKHKGYEPANPSRHAGKGPWVKVALRHDQYDADWNNEHGINESQAARARTYAARPGKLPPGMAFFSGRLARRKSKLAYVADGNHRAYAAYLRGEPTATFYMPEADYLRWKAAQ